MQQAQSFPKTSMTPGADFFRAFLRNWREVGWPLQTSRNATQKICTRIDFQRVRRIVEIGAGTGNVTKEILKRLATDGELIVFEINSQLCRHLREIGDRRVVVYNASGFDVHGAVTEKADCVISAVPVATLSSASFAHFYEGVKAIL